MSPVLDRRLAWAKGLVALGLLLFTPLLLFATPLFRWAELWVFLLLAALVGFSLAAAVGAMAGANLPVLVWMEGRLRAWVARFAKDPEGLWLHWIRHAHYPAVARSYLERAVRLGGREALFQEALVFLEGGWGAGGQGAGVERLRRAAQAGHLEAAFRLAEALRTGCGTVLPEPAEAERWYLRAASRGCGPAAAWLAHAYACGDGVAPDEVKARVWQQEAERLQPHPPLSHSLLRHDAGPADPLVRLASASLHGAEGAADRALARRSGRVMLLLGSLGLASGVLYVVGLVFWTGSSQLHHLPLLMLAPLLAMLVWQARLLGKGGKRSGRSRLREAAEAGDPEACYRLGLDHRRGTPECPRDDLTAGLWFRKAAEAGHRGAMEALAEACLGGHGMIRDAREAARWAEAARRESTS